MEDSRTVPLGFRIMRKSLPLTLTASEKEAGGKMAFVGLMLLIATAILAATEIAAEHDFRAMVIIFTGIAATALAIFAIFLKS